MVEPAGAALELVGDGVSLRLHHGEAVAVVSRPGSGKTALLRIAAGLDPVGEGARTLRAERTAFVFQQGGLVRNVTIAENLLLPLYYARLARAEAEERTARALALFDLSDVAAERPGGLLNETRLLAQFARAAALEADLLFVDEAFAQLSRTSAARAEAYLAAEVGRGRLAVMMTAVEPQAVPQLPTRILGLAVP